jgi:hypothetical protein
MEIKTQLALMLTTKQKEQFKGAVKSRGWRTITQFCRAVIDNPKLIEVYEE